MLLKLLSVKTPITEADGIRALACRVSEIEIFTRKDKQNGNKQTNHA